MLRYFYYSDTNISMLHATELVDFSKDFHLNKLYKVLEKVIGGQDISIETVLSVLDVAYNPLLEENPALQKNLQEEGLNFAVNQVDKINFEPLQMMNPVIATNILQALQRKIGKNWNNILKAEGNEKPLRLDEIKSSQGNAAGWAKSSPRKPEIKKEPTSSGGDSMAKSPSKAAIAEKKSSSSDKKSSDKKPAEGEKREERKKETAPSEKKDDKKEEDAKTPSKSKSKRHEDGQVQTAKK